MNDVEFDAPGKKYVILGGSGYLGSSLANYLKSIGCNVRTFSSSQADLLTENSLELLENEVDSDTNLIIAAGKISATYLDDIECFSANSIIGVNAARLITRSPVKSCTYFSSISVYGDNTTNIDLVETAPVDPVTNYGVGKYSGERLIGMAAREMNIPFLGLRICRVYGPGAKDHFYGPSRFLRSIIGNNKIELYGDGSEIRELIYIDDFNRIVERLISGGNSGIFNIGSRNDKSFKYMIDVLRKISQESFDVVSKPRTRPKVDIRYDNSKLVNACPGIDFTSLEDGLTVAYDSFKRNLDYAKIFV